MYPFSKTDVESAAGEKAASMAGGSTWFSGASGSKLGSKTGSVPLRSPNTAGFHHDSTADVLTPEDIRKSRAKLPEEKESDETKKKGIEKIIAKSQAKKAPLPPPKRIPLRRKPFGEFKQQVKYIIF